MDQRLRTRERLSTRGEYTRCYREGQRRRTQYFIVHAYHRGGSGARLGLAVSRTVGHAVARNRVKRRLRELFRRNKTGIPLGYDVFVRALPASARATFPELSAAWGDVFARLAGATGLEGHEATVQPEEHGDATRSA